MTDSQQTQPSPTLAKEAIGKKEKRNKVKNDTIFNVLGTASLVTVAVLLYYLPAFRQKAEELQVYTISLDSLWYVLSGFLFHFIFRKSFYKLSKDFLTKNLHPKTQYYPPQQKIDKIKTFSNQICDTIYYTAISIIYFFLFRGQRWFPYLAGGCASCQDLFIDYPHWPQTGRSFFEMFYPFQLGMYVFHMVDLCYLDRQLFKRRNFGELLFHHIISAILILSFNLYNMLAAGSMALFVHDASDAVRAFTRIIGQSNFYIKYLRFSYCFNYFYLIAWVYFRTIVFPFCLISSQYIFMESETNQWTQFRAPHMCVLVLNSALFFIQVYWSFLIQQSIERQYLYNKQIATELQQKKSVKAE